MRKLFFLISLFAAGLCIAKPKSVKEPLRISILGDSYSTFEGHLTPDTNFVWYFPVESRWAQKQNDVHQVEQTWWWQVIERMKAKLELNNAFSGSTICYTGYNKEDYSDRAFITRSNKLGNPDIILICGGTNDSWAGSPIGDYVYGNWTKAELYSFRPAMAKMLYDLKANYPTARLVFMLNSELKPEINESVHTICKHYDVPCLDLQNVDKQQGHPSIAGMKAIADQVVNFLK